MKKILSLILVFCILLGTVPANLIHALSLNNLPGAVRVDNNLMNLEDVINLVKKDGADLSRTINVDGKTITFGDLKKMVEIEEELKPLYDKYANIKGVRATSEHLATRESLVNWLQTDGQADLLEDFLQNMLASNNITENSSEDISALGPGGIVGVDSLPCIDASEKTITIDLTNDNQYFEWTITNPADFPISFAYRTLDGSALAGVDYEGISGEYSNGYQRVILDGEGSYKIRVKILHAVSDNMKTISDDNGNNFWEGEKCFYIEIADAENCSFSNNLCKVKINQAEDAAFPSYNWVNYNAAMDNADIVKDYNAVPIGFKYTLPFVIAVEESTDGYTYRAGACSAYYASGTWLDWWPEPATICRAVRYTDYLSDTINFKYEDPLTPMKTIKHSELPNLGIVTQYYIDEPTRWWICRGHASTLTFNYRVLNQVTQSWTLKGGLRLRLQPSSYVRTAVNDPLPGILNGNACYNVPVKAYEQHSYGLDNYIFDLISKFESTVMSNNLLTANTSKVYSTSIALNDDLKSAIRDGSCKTILSSSCPEGLDVEVPSGGYSKEEVLGECCIKMEEKLVSSKVANLDYVYVQPTKIRNNKPFPVIYQFSDYVKDISDLKYGDSEDAKITLQKGESQGASLRSRYSAIFDPSGDMTEKFSVDSGKNVSGADLNSDPNLKNKTLNNIVEINNINNDLAQSLENDFQFVDSPLDLISSCEEDLSINVEEIDRTHRRAIVTYPTSSEVGSADFTLAQAIENSTDSNGKVGGAKLAVGDNGNKFVGLYVGFDSNGNAIPGTLYATWEDDQSETPQTRKAQVYTNFSRYNAVLNDDGKFMGVSEWTADYTQALKLSATDIIMDRPIGAVSFNDSGEVVFNSSRTCKLRLGLQRNDLVNGTPKYADEELSDTIKYTVDLGSSNSNLGQILTDVENELNTNDGAISSEVLDRWIAANVYDGSNPNGYCITVCAKVYDENDSCTGVSKNFSLYAVAGKAQGYIGNILTAEKSHIMEGDNLNVSWQTNHVMDRIDSTTNYELNIYGGQLAYENPNDIENAHRFSEGVSPVYTRSLYSGDVTENVINAEKEIRNVSCDMPFSGLNMQAENWYTVELCCKDPSADVQDIKEIITQVYVHPLIPSIKLDKLENYYYIDTNFNNQKTVNLSYSTKNLREGYSVALSCMKNGEEYSLNGSSLMLTKVGAATRLKDIYNINACIKDSQGNRIAEDSCIIQVYNDSAFKLYIDDIQENVNGTNQNMSNVSYIRNLYNNGNGYQQILDLRRAIELKKTISINKNEYDWGAITDQLKWSACDFNTDGLTVKSEGSNDILSANYPVNGKYEPVCEGYSYRPQLSVMLAGKKDGKSRVTATHACTGKKMQVDLTVETLKDKLYLFNFYPKQLTEVTYDAYTNSEKTATVTRNITSNTLGELAVFEDYGIAGNIHMKAEASTGDVYQGTIRQEDLVSSEKDASKLELYPVNIFKLRQVGNIELYFKDENGNPYASKTVKVCGAVYKNNVLCEDSIIKADTINGKPESQGGKGLNEITLGSDGRFNLKIDPTQIYCESLGETEANIGATDEIKFVYEVVFENNEYLPQLIDIKTQTSELDNIRFGESVVSLKKASDDSRNRPFVAKETVVHDFYGANEMDITDDDTTIGPSDLYPSGKLKTFVFWWGEDYNTVRADRAIEVQYDYGRAIPNESSVNNMYSEFSSIPISMSICPLNKDMGLRPRGEEIVGAKTIIKAGNTVIRELKNKFKFANMIGAQAQENVNGAREYLAPYFCNFMSSQLGESRFGSGDIDKPSSNMVKFLQGDFPCPLLNTGIFATEDPTVYKYFAGGGIDLLGLDSSAVYKPATKSMTKVNKAKLKSNLKEFKQTKSVSFAPKPGSSNLNKSRVNIQFYVEGEIYYKDGQWKTNVTGGGFTLGYGASYKKCFNASAGPIPVTGEIGLGAGAYVSANFRTQLDSFSQQINAYREDHGSVLSLEELMDIDSKITSGILTKLRISAYLRVFGGVGFDNTVVALKIGLFGQVNLDYTGLFLNRDYINDEKMIECGFKDRKKMNGHEVRLYATMGVEFYAQFLFLSYREVFASTDFGGGGRWPSGDWNYINDWLNESHFITGSAGFSTDENGNLKMLTSVFDESSVENRDYLAKGSKWESGQHGGFGRLMNNVFGMFGGSLMSSADEEDIRIIENNAYSNASPMITRDGQLFAYLSAGTDINDTRACYAIKNGDGFIDQGPIFENEETLDNNLDLDGTKEFAVAAWEEQKEATEKQSGEDFTNRDAGNLINNNKIKVGIYNGSDWTAKEFESDIAGYMAPRVLVRNGKALVLWRSVASSSTDEEGLMKFDAENKVLYSTYNGTDWSDVKTLYNGSLGKIYSLDGDMLSDGKAMVSMSIVNKDAVEGGDKAAQQDICYYIIDSDGNPAGFTRLTNDDLPDENVKTSVASFDGEEKFVMAWHHMDEDNNSDIKIAVIDSNNKVCADLPDSIVSTVNGKGVLISDKFDFVKTDSTDINNLAIIWSAVQEGEVDATQVQGEELKAVKFLKEDSKISLSAPLSIAGASSGTVIDHYDACINGNQLSAILQDTVYGEMVPTKDSSGNNVFDSEGKMVYTAEKGYNIGYASKSIANDFEMESVNFDYDNVRKDSCMPIEFKVLNSGKDAITSLKLEVFESEGTTPVITKEYTNEDDFKLLPNDSKLIAVNYDTPSKIVDLRYKVTASFVDGDRVYEDRIPLAVSDIGIARIKQVGSSDGKREYEAVLCNNTDVPIGDDNQINFALYPSEMVDEDDANPKIIELPEGVSSDGISVDGEGIITITDSAMKALADNGALTFRFIYDVTSNDSNQLEDGEISGRGLNLIAKTWLTDDGGNIIDEAYAGNNEYILKIDSLLKGHPGEKFSFSTDLINSAEKSMAKISVQNNSLKDIGNINVTANLLDRSGNVIETKIINSMESEQETPLRSFMNVFAADSLSFGGEEEKSFSVNFDKLGDSISVSAVSLVSEDSAELSELSFSGINISKDNFTYNGESGRYEYSLNTENLTSTQVKAVANSANAVVTINNVQTTTSTVSLSRGKNTIEVKSTCGDETIIYFLTLNNSINQETNVAGLDIIGGSNWQNKDIKCEVSASGIENIKSCKYSLDGGLTWTETTKKDGTKYIFTITEDGDYTNKIQAKLTYTDTSINKDMDVSSIIQTAKLDKTLSEINSDSFDYEQDSGNNLKFVCSVNITDNCGIDKIEVSVSERCAVISQPALNINDAYEFEVTREDESVPININIKVTDVAANIAEEDFVIKGIPYITKLPVLEELTYGDELTELGFSGYQVSTNGEFSWAEYNEDLTAGSHTCFVVFTPTDTANYETLTKEFFDNPPYNVTSQSLELSVKVNKADPTYTAPTGLTATYADGQKISAVSLANEGDGDGCFEWMDSNEFVGNASSDPREFFAKFIPADTDNYKTVENISVYVTVNKADPTYTAPTGLTATYADDQRISEVSLTNEGGGDGHFEWMDSDTLVGNASSDPREFFAKFIPDTDNYKTVENISVYLTVNKANPTYTTPTGLTAIYGQMLKDIILPVVQGGVFSWERDENTLVGNAGVNSFNVTYTPNDTDNYNTMNEISVDIETAKANPTYTTPTGLTAIYGQMLKNIILPVAQGGVFSWERDENTPVGNAGVNSFNVIYTPNDEDNYNTINEISVDIETAKADPEFTVPLGLIATYGSKLSDVNLNLANSNGMFKWQDEKNRSVGDIGLNQFKVTFIHNDSNYKEVRDIDIEIDVQPTDMMRDAISKITGLMDEITSDGVKDVVLATKAFEALTSPEQNQIESGKVNKLRTAQARSGKINRMHNGLSVAGKNLPWYVKLSAENLGSDTAEWKNLESKIGDNDILSLYDIDLENLKDELPYVINDGDSVSLEIPTPDLAGYEDIGVFHEKSDGTIEHIKPTIEDGMATVDATSFSVYGLEGKRISGNIGPVYTNGYAENSTGNNSNFVPSNSPESSTGGGSIVSSAASGNGNEAAKFTDTQIYEVIILGFILLSIFAILFFIVDKKSKLK